ncbi:MAG TPA: hypothetical protein VKB17_01560 [Thermoleophilaceae bacterium]|nr:hypothetical protein [Thermoleophilaceae bacterium]
MDRSAVGALVRGVITTTALAASALSHVGWWLDWQARANTDQGCRPLD